MTVIDLRMRRSRERGTGDVPTGGRLVEGVDIHPERDLLRTAAGRHAGWPVAALDGALSVLGAGLATVLIPSMTVATALASVVGWGLALVSTRRYGNQLRHGEVRDLDVIASAAVRLCAALALLTVFVPSIPIAGLVVSALSVAAFTAMGRRTLAERLMPRAARRGGQVPVLVRGPGRDVQKFLAGLEADAADRYRLVGVQVTDDYVTGDRLVGHTLVAATRDPVEAAIHGGARAVMLVGSQQDSSDDLRRTVWRLEGHGIATHMVPIVADLAAPSASTIPGTGLPLLSFQSRDIGAEVGISKVVLDKILALGALALLSPVIVVTSLAVRLTSPGPVVFRQVRVGRGGREFVMLKFRTMYRDAEARRAELEALNQHDSGVLFKIKHDPRVTPVGYWLRKFSLDELPQLVNVLKGEMSLVGPRPPLPREVENFHLDAHRRFRVRPGLTGLWQVSGRSDLDPDRSVHLDTHYVEQWSPVMDAKILVRTPGVVLSGKGAY